MLERRTHRVVIADDNRTNQILLDRILTNSGFDTVKAGTGSAVLDKLYGDERVDAVLMDVCMPELDGIETIKLIRFAEVGKGTPQRTPILAMSADNTIAVKVACMNAGADGFIAHPIVFTKLVNSIGELIEAREAREVQAANKVVQLAERSAVRAPVVDMRIIRDLKQKYGSRLLQDLAISIKADAEIALNFMQAAVDADDLLGFRDQAMSIFSSTASLEAVGIRRIFESTKSLKKSSLKVSGPIIIACLQVEAAAIVKTLQDYQNDDAPFLAEAI